MHHDDMLHLLRLADGLADKAEEVIYGNATGKKKLDIQGLHQAQARYSEKRRQYWGGKPF